MTQTIKNCNEAPMGKTYPVEHLRTAESIEQLFGYVDAGHPIATYRGFEVRLLRSNGDYFYYDERLKQAGYWICSCVSRKNLLGDIKLAPLAYRNDRPLHVGDKIKLTSSLSYNPKILTITFYDIKETVEGKFDWRFADEVI